MRLLISKFFRNYIKNNTPTCYAFQYIPDSLDDVCDCETFCKYPPKGNSRILNFDKFLINKENVPEIILNKNIDVINQEKKNV